MRKKSANSIFSRGNRHSPAKDTFTRPAQLAEKQISSPSTIILQNRKRKTGSISPPAKASSLSSKAKIKKGVGLFDYAH